MRQTLIFYARVESGHASRQKTRGMCDFCLLAGPNSGRAILKVDKKLGECLIFVYQTLQIRGVRNRK